MMNNILKVYGEDLINAAINTASISGTTAVAAGTTQGALTVNVFSIGETTATEAITVTIKNSASENGVYADLQTITIAKGSSFSDGELMASVILPTETKAFLMASVVSDATNSGHIRVTLGYLAR